MFAHLAALQKELVVLGGAINHSGNVNPAAEANFFADPLAADEVLGASSNIKVGRLSACAGSRQQCQARVSPCAGSRQLSTRPAAPPPPPTPPTQFTPLTPPLPTPRPHPHPQVVGLGVTHRCRLTAAQLAELAGCGRHGAFLSSISDFYLDFHKAMYPSGAGRGWQGAAGGCTFVWGGEGSIQVRCRPTLLPRPHTHPTHTPHLRPTNAPLTHPKLTLKSPTLTLQAWMASICTTPPPWPPHCAPTCSPGGAAQCASSQRALQRVTASWMTPAVNSWSRMRGARSGLKLRWLWMWTVRAWRPGCGSGLHGSACLRRGEGLRPLWYRSTEMYM